jgi:hypothetical protein
VRATPCDGAAYMEGREGSGLKRERYRCRRREAERMAVRWRVCPGGEGVVVWWLEAFVLAGN